MGIVFVAFQDQSGPVLMDCGNHWGEFFVQFSDFVASYYDQHPMFMWDGEIKSDFIYIDMPKMQILFEAASKQPERLFMGWAEIVVAMLEVSTKKPWREMWQKEFEDFRPSYRGVSREDIPTF